MDGVGCVYGVELAFTWLDLSLVAAIFYLATKSQPFP